MFQCNKTAMKKVLYPTMHVGRSHIGVRTKRLKSLKLKIKNNSFNVRRWLYTANCLSHPSTKSFEIKRTSRLLNIRLFFSFAPTGGQRQVEDKGIVGTAKLVVTQGSIDKSSHTVCRRTVHLKRQELIGRDYAGVEVFSMRGNIIWPDGHGQKHGI